MNMTLPLASIQMAAQTQSPQLVKWPSDRRPTNRRLCRACSGCRARKVRCDASGNGEPCTNCRLDGVKCMVSESKRIRKIPASIASRQGGRRGNKSPVSAGDIRTPPSHSPSSSSSTDGDGDTPGRRKSIMDNWWDLDLISRLSCMQYQIQEQSLAIHRQSVHEVDARYQQWIPITISHEEPRVRPGVDVVNFLSGFRLAPGEWNLFSPVTGIGEQREVESPGEVIKEEERDGMVDVEWEREEGEEVEKEVVKEDENGISINDFEDLINYAASADPE